MRQRVAELGAPYWRWIHIKYFFNRQLDIMACGIAHRLPRRIRHWAVIDAAVRATECGWTTDELTFQHLTDATERKS